MSFDVEENRVVIFGNKNKKSAKSPDFIATANVEGKVVTFSLWKQTSSKGDSYLSGLINDPEKSPAKKAPAVVKKAVVNDPF